MENDEGIRDSPARGHTSVDGSELPGDAEDTGDERENDDRGARSLPAPTHEWDDLIPLVIDALEERGISRSHLCAVLCLSPPDLASYLRRKSLKADKLEAYRAALSAWVTDAGFSVATPSVTFSTARMVPPKSTLSQPPKALKRPLPAACSGGGEGSSGLSPPPKVPRRTLPAACSGGSGGGGSTGGGGGSSDPTCIDIAGSGDPASADGPYNEGSAKRPRQAAPHARADSEGAGSDAGASGKARLE